jgi:membrane protein required for colicin V production
VNLLDALLVILVAASVATGFMAGFARVGIGFIAAVSGVLFGFWFYGIPAEWIQEHWVSSNTAASLLGFFVVFFAFVVAGALIGKLLAKAFRWTGLSWLDRLMGGAFGFLRGGLIAIAFVAVLLAFTPKPLPNWMVDSKILPYAINASDVCAALAPSVIKDGFRESMAEIRKLWDEQLKKKKKKQDLKPVDA